MTSMSSAALSSWARPALNWPEPLRAMVPRLDSRSSRVMPMPLSDTVRVRFSLSGTMVIFRSARLTPMESSVRDL